MSYRVMESQPSSPSHDAEYVHFFSGYVQTHAFSFHKCIVEQKTYIEKPFEHCSNNKPLMMNDSDIMAWHISMDFDPYFPSM